MKRELNRMEISYLFTFVEKKGVKYLDLQHELVDHLATGIENELEKDNTLSFDDALDIIYKRFSTKGFSPLIRKKEKAMMAYWRRKTWLFIKRFFQLPLILLAILIYIVSFHLLLNYEKGDWILMGGVILSFISIYMQWRNGGMRKSKKLLVYKTFNSNGFGIAGYMGLNLNVQFPAFENIYASTIYAFINVFVIILLYGTFTAFPRWIEEEIEKKYQNIDINNLSISKS